MATCDDYRLALSSHADGEDAALSPIEVDAHVATCDACAAYAVELLEVEQLVAAASEAPTPDLTAGILVAVDLPDAAAVRERRRQVRGLVALAGVVQLILSVPVLIGLGSHATRDLATFEVALAGALLYAAWRPRAAAGLLPMVALVGLVGVASTIAAAIAGSASIGTEAVHVLPIAAAVPLGLLARDDRAGVAAHEVRA